MTTLTGKTIGQLISLSAITDNTLFPVEFSGKTYHIPYSAFTTVLTSGTLSSGTLTLNSANGNPVVVTGFTDNNTSVTGTTFNGQTNVLTIGSNDGSEVSTLINRYNRWYIPSGYTYTVENGYQSFIFGDLVVEGTIDLQDTGELVVLNGNLDLSGGTIIGSGTTTVISLPEYDTFLTGGTFDPITKQITLTGNFDFLPVNVDLSSISTEDFYTTGGTYNSITESIDFSGNSSATTFSVDVSQLLDDTNTYVTGGTYSTGILTLERNDGNSVTITGFTDNTDNYTTGGTYNSITESIDFSGNSSATTFSVDVSQLLDDTNTYTTGATLSGTTVIFDRNDLTNAYSVDLSPLIFTGNTSGDCITDLYITNLYGCSPITVWDSIQFSGSTASGNGSFAFGLNTLASGDYSHAEGYVSSAVGDYSHAEGHQTLASGNSSHSEGYDTVSIGDYSHAEGELSTTYGSHSHAEGTSITYGSFSHSQNYNTITYGTNSHAGGDNSIASGNTSFIHSTNSLVTGNRSVVLGGQNITGTTDDTVYVPYLNISNISTGTSINNLGIDSNGFVVSTSTFPPTLNYGLFAQTGDSAVVSATTVETTIIDGGVGTLSVPVNGFNIGDSFKVDMGGIFSNANNETIRLRVKSGSVDLADSGVQTLSTHSNDIFKLEITFTIRNIGGAGTASVISFGSFQTIKKNSSNIAGFGFELNNNTTFDTTISNTLDITVEWGSNNANNSIKSQTLILNKIY
jgi:hypothetical protein